MNGIQVEVWGDFACFTRPESKVERLTYPVMTPSAARGILSAIYSKPVEFYWQIRKIEVLRPIRYLSFKRNEVIKYNVSKSPQPMLVEDVRTQRQSVVLKDVRYRITAEIIPRENFCGTAQQLYEQAMRRVGAGKCFFQPSLGLREFVCYFDLPTDRPPIAESMDLGIMLYDVFDLHRFEKTAKPEPFVSVFRANLDHGVMNVPDFDSEAVLKPERG